MEESLSRQHGQAYGSERKRENQRLRGVLENQGVDGLSEEDKKHPYVELWQWSHEAGERAKEAARLKALEPKPVPVPRYNSAPAPARDPYGSRYGSSSSGSGNTWDGNNWASRDRW